MLFAKSKFCMNCRMQKPLTEFQKDSHRSDGYRSSCKTCVNRRRREQSAAKKKPEPKTPKTIVRASVPILDERLTILDDISRLFGRYVQIGLHENGHCWLRAYGSYKEEFTADTPEELLTAIFSPPPATEQTDR